MNQPHHKFKKTTKHYLSDIVTEEYFLSALMVSQQAFFEAHDVEPKWFDGYQTRETFKALRVVFSSSDVATTDIVFDLLTELDKQGRLAKVWNHPTDAADWLRKIKGLMSTQVSPWGDHYERLRSTYQRRAIHTITTEVSSTLETVADPEAYGREAIEKIGEVLTPSSRKDGGLTGLANDWLERVDKAHTGSEDEQEQIVVPTNVDVVDKLIGGVSLGHYLMVAARPKHGKSRLTMRIAYELAVTQGWSVDIFSHEMSRRDVFGSMFAVCCSGYTWKEITNRKKWENGNEWARIAAETAATLSPLDVNIYSGRRDISEIESRVQARKAALGDKPYVLVIDYVQAFKSANTSSEYERVTDISLRLASMAHKLEILVLCAAQFNRGAAERMPKPSDLRSSGQLEQDVDQLLIWNRPEFDPDKRKTGSENKGMLAAALNRHGGESSNLLVHCDLGRLTFEEGWQ